MKTKPTIGFDGRTYHAQAKKCYGFGDSQEEAIENLKKEIRTQRLISGFSIIGILLLIASWGLLI